MGPVYEAAATCMINQAMQRRHKKLSLRRQRTTFHMNNYTSRNENGTRLFKSGPFKVLRKLSSALTFKTLYIQMNMQ